MNTCHAKHLTIGPWCCLKFSVFNTGDYDDDGDDDTRSVDMLLDAALDL